MKKWYVIWPITAAMLVCVFSVSGCNYSLSLLLANNSHMSCSELTPKQVERIFLKYENELTTIAEYVSREERWNSYVTDVWDNEDAYTNADFLPEQIKENMDVYFEKISRNGSIHRICEEEYDYFKAKPSGEKGAVFFIRVVDKGKDAEGSDVIVYQHLVYLTSDNPELYLKQIWLSVLGSIEQIVDNWYLVTTMNP